VVDELHRSSPHHTDLFLGPLPLAEDRRAGGEELDLDALGQPLERRGIQLAERVMVLNELGDVVHAHSIIGLRAHRSRNVSRNLVPAFTELSVARTNTW
jgi:hypothetical protein